MPAHPPTSVRALLLTPEARLLLVQVRGESGDLWITPGGRREVGELKLATLRRELAEEVGLGAFEERGEVWVRRGSYVADGVRLSEVEHFFLVPTEEFEPVADGLEEAERARFLGFRWWGLEELRTSSARFVPRELGRLVAELVAEGAPAAPLEIVE